MVPLMCVNCKLYAAPEVNDNVTEYGPDVIGDETLLMFIVVDGTPKSTVGGLGVIKLSDEHPIVITSNE